MNLSVVAENQIKNKTHKFDHTVQFYKKDAFLCETVSRYTHSGLLKGEGAIIIATSEHNLQIKGFLLSLGLNVQPYIERGQLLILDAQETLDKFMRNDMPDYDLFLNAVGNAIDEMAKSYKLIRAYGEMVDVLWSNENLKGTIALEKSWSELSKTKSFSLLCGYAFENFQKEIDGVMFKDICDCHEHVILADHEEIVDNQSYLIAELQQQRAALQTEIAERKSIELALLENQEELKKAKESAEAASIAKGHFLANMSHEIRSPLNTILGFTELMKDENLTSAERKTYANVIDRNGRHLSTVINDILDISKVEAGKLDVEYINFPLQSLLADVVSMHGFEAERKGIKLIIETFPKGIPEQICSDSTRLHQIFDNLIGNAIKFTHEGSVSISVETQVSKSKNTIIGVRVKDTGIGINSTAQTKIFKPFSQGDASTTRRYGGTGLGLVLSRKLAQLLGGDIELAESEIGKGSTFLVRFNANLDKLASNETKLEKISKAVLKSKPTRELEGIRILVADDSADNQLLLQHFLETEGVIVETASNGLEAVEKALKGDFHVILMDVMMPICDGYDATRRLRTVGFKKPILALTAHALSEERNRSIAEGCNDHLTKPLNKRLLISAITKQVFNT